MVPSERMPSGPRRVGAATILVAVLAGRGAAADPVPSLQVAREQYDRAVQLHAQGDYAASARAFARADRIVPNDAVLRDALTEAMRAGDAALAWMLVARCRRSPANGELAALAERARDRFRSGAGKIEASCPGPCVVEIDGRRLDEDTDGWVTTGSHAVVLVDPAQPTRRDAHRVEVVPLETTVVHFVPPASTASPPATAATAATVTTVSTPPSSAEPAPRAAPAHGGVAPVWFWVGVGATAVLGGAATVSWLDAEGTHRDFVRNGCSDAGSDACDAQASAGRSAVTRTNVLLGVTAGAAIATAVIGLFLVPWRSGHADVARGLPHAWTSRR